MILVQSGQRPELVSVEKDWDELRQGSERLIKSGDSWFSTKYILV